MILMVSTGISRKRKVKVKTGWGELDLIDLI